MVFIYIVDFLKNTMRKIIINYMLSRLVIYIIAEKQYYKQLKLRVVGYNKKIKKYIYKMIFLIMYF